MAWLKCQNDYVNFMYMGNEPLFASPYTVTSLQFNGLRNIIALSYMLYGGKNKTIPN